MIESLQDLPGSYVESKSPAFTSFTLTVDPTGSSMTLHDLDYLLQSYGVSSAKFLPNLHGFVLLLVWDDSYSGDSENLDELRLLQQNMLQDISDHNIQVVDIS